MACFEGVVRLFLKMFFIGFSWFLKMVFIGLVGFEDFCK